MDLTISVGWWTIPALVSVAALAAAYIATKRLPEPSRGDYSAVGNMALGLVAFVWFASAIIVSLLAWLIYALVI